MLTTAERVELITQLKYIRQNPLMIMTVGEGDVIELRLGDDDREMFECSESIARGDACLSCEQVWVPDGPPTKYGQQRKLDHLPSCVYSARLMEEDL